MECSDCKWMKWLDDSNGDMIYFCMNADSGAYLEVTGICGNCDLEQEKDDAEVD